jgi:hypothetical protein
MSSDPSPWDPRGERLNEREFRGVERRVRLPGELVREGAAEELGDWTSETEAWFSVDSERPVISGCEDWTGFEYRGLEAEEGGSAGENEGGGLTGGASSGDVMDSSGD